MKSSVPKKAEDVINTLIAVYEKDAIDDKRGSQKARDNSSTIGWRSSPKN